jgi:hypothetical protein
MQEYEKQIILRTFLKCFGLRSALLKENDSLLREASLESLATQSGMRKSYIEENLTEILNLR